MVTKAHPGERLFFEHRPDDRIQNEVTTERLECVNRSRFHILYCVDHTEAALAQFA